MGFFDNVQSTFNKGTAAVQRTSRTTQLKSQINNLMKQRRDLAAQLGASLYDVVKDNPELRAGREPLIDGIRNIDDQRAAIEAEIARIEEEIAAQQVANSTYRCPKCGSTVGGDDLFCSGCGLPIAEVKAAYAANASSVATSPTGAVCMSCGAPLNEGDAFCMTCGAKIEHAPEPIPMVIPESEHEPDPVPAFAPEPEPEPVEPFTPIPAREPISPIENSTELDVEYVQRPAHVDKQPSGGFCAHCGNRLDTDDAFCAVCGTPTA